MFTYTISKLEYLKHYLKQLNHSVKIVYLSFVEIPKIPDLEVSLVSTRGNEGLVGVPVDDVDVGVVGVRHREHAGLVGTSSERQKNDFNQ